MKRNDDFDFEAIVFICCNLNNLCESHGEECNKVQNAAVESAAVIPQATD